MNLEQLRKQAKQLVRAARGGDADALARLGGREPTLASAQLVVARGYGYSSWPGLVAAAEASVDAFVVAATDNRRQRAERLLAARPDGPITALYGAAGLHHDPDLTRLLLEAGAD